MRIEFTREIEEQANFCFTLEEIREALLLYLDDIDKAPTGHYDTCRWDNLTDGFIMTFVNNKSEESEETIPTKSTLKKKAKKKPLRKKKVSK